ncbi:uncharacterized protein FA14DRAFT_174026 [Meira miltonrushii]|uniref:BRCA2 OB1 domain-containing protein n=1 Tax=Meira miltonrushii TaxID=1280837 RepID=A0A316VA36_9BASI|nr:uncharacterized protein FA14DRAFT_174026 [Meira miltonrushii]PWN34330.1 hypothetical protein FA14DRAFT_174026 [Meira miltonrushii]
MSDSRDCQVITPQRTLRDRDASQPNHRPRPALASSARGLAKQELRRQRELEANLEFAKANEKLKKATKAGSRKSSSSQASVDSEAYSSQQAHTFDDNSSNSQENHQVQANLLSQQSQVSSSEKMVEDLVSNVAPAEASEQISSDLSLKTPESRKRTIEDVEGEQDRQSVSARVDTSEAAAISAVVSDPMPPAKKINSAVIEYDDDSGFWDDADMDWDVLDQIDPPTQPVQAPPLAESEGVFRWANKKSVVGTAKAADAAFRLQQFLEEEEEGGLPSTQIAGPSQAAVAPRTPFRPLAPSRLNQSVTNWNEQAQDTSGKQVDKAADAIASIQSPAHMFQSAATLRTPNGASQGARMPLPNNRVINSTPRKREVCYGSMPSGSQKVGHLSQTPLSRKSLSNALRFGRSSLPKFKSPFKKDIAQTAVHATQLTSSPLQNRSRLVTTLPRVKLENERVSATVFNLDNLPEQRKTLLDAEKSSQWAWYRGESFKQSDDYEFISKILNDPPSAALFSFTDPANPEGSASLDISAARKELAEAAGCSVDKIPYTWVKNHWSLILWKLAALAHRSEEYEQRFSWNEVISQLRYRYEREVNRAHRSAIKRIQEHDSPSGLPMILCVYDASHGADEDEPHLILTDGWYRIHAPLDEVLSRAVRAGRIQRGQKMTIMGAHLDPESSACEPIEAFDTSPLLIRGNGCKLAPWHARLGFQKVSWASSIRSLTVDGGSVSILDAVVTKVYPKGFMSSTWTAAEAELNGNGDSSQQQDQPKEFNRPETWNEKEEEEKQSEWNNKRISTVDEIRKTLQSQSEKLIIVTEMLSEKCQDLDENVVIDGLASSSCESFLDAMLASDNPSDYVKNVGMVPALLRVAQTRLDILMSANQAEMERRLADLCPPRQRRAFRTIRLIDTKRFIAEQKSKDPSVKEEQSLSSLQQSKLIGCKRECLIRIWDADKMEEMDFKEGCRYNITNLTPSNVNIWPKDVDGLDEVHLNTRQDSRWEEISLNGA